MSNHHHHLLLLSCATLLLLLVSGTCAAYCTANLEQPNVCLFDPDLDIERSRECRDANQDPFSVLAPGGSGKNCKSLVKSEGGTCINRYARYVCNYYCAECRRSISLDICKSVCDDTEAACPKAWAAGCFNEQFSCAAQDDNTCSAMKVDLPSSAPTPNPSPSSSASSLTFAAAAVPLIGAVVF
eukprot:CAMPEP_0174241866 /NCGR_PEP_ID=MMETSP0417-20130205/25253_1 /TAXON_ID=242541 /ORGANISM="Mayorella sp, Strain BSH-02190019" /LENGTH=183 /DNA_ID=CAMNT_0015321181 /DNA_START=187 /DNA_END=735 /DNA_ORIENTATION=-